MTKKELLKLIEKIPEDTEIFFYAEFENFHYPVEKVWSEHLPLMTGVQLILGVNYGG